MLVIVPDSLHDQINAAIDKALAGRPCDAETREHIYTTLLTYFDKHGKIPDFKLESTCATPSKS